MKTIYTQVKVFLLALIIIIVPKIAFAEDWPTWRYDAGRTASSVEELPDQLFLQWTRHYAPRVQVWDDPLNNDLMQYDKFFEPIAVGNTLYMGFNDQDKIVAIDTESGDELWSFYADGPVRLPLSYNNDKLYFTSDDGYLYCVSAKKGELIWRFSGGPAQRKMLGNKRFISTWPARGGVVVDEGKAYFAASIWPSMGTYIYAIDAESGQVIWQNDGTGSDYIKQPHNASAFAGIAPQGTMAVNGDNLIIPGGRSVSGCFDKNTGEEKYYHISKYNKSGGSFVSTRGKWFVNHHRERNTYMYKTEDGTRVSKVLEKYPVLGKDLFYFSGDAVVARDPNNPDEIVWTLDVDASGDLIQAGSRLYAGGKNGLTAIQLNNGKASIAWDQKIKGGIGRIIAANGKIFVVTMDGKILAFGGEQPKNIIDIPMSNKPIKISKSANVLAKEIIEKSEINSGYAMYFGGKNPALLAALAQQSELSFVAVVDGDSKVNDLREKFDKMGIKASRVAFLEETPKSMDFAPYFASLTVVEDIGEFEPESSKILLEKIYASTHPFGGKIWIGGNSSRITQISSVASSAEFDGLDKLEANSDHVFLSRSGAPKGSANWTHLYGDISNTIKSDDELVKLPLGVLWFGGISNMEVLPRHGHGPPEQVVNGKLIIQGLNSISARDVYTGRPLWKKEFETLGTYGMYYNESYSDDPLNTAYNQEHIPGVNTRGTNYVVTEDWVYVVQGYSCHVLDIETGELIKTVRIPKHDRDQWGYIGVAGNNLIAGAEFVKYGAVVQKGLKSEEDIQTYVELIEADNKRTGGFKEYGFSASQSIVVADRHNMKMKWDVKAKFGFIHNTIISNDKAIFAIDKVPASMRNVLSRRGIDIEGDFSLTSFDIETGDTLWQNKDKVFGSWLGYNKEFDILLQATRPSRDMISGEPGDRMIAFRGSDGKLLWDRKIEYHNPPILHGQQIIVDDAAYDITNGDRIQRINPITREEINWTYSRTYGCNYIIGSEHMLSFRSGAAGFYDLENQGGTGNLGGFKSGCTSNLVAANGVLNAPDYTRTCSCSYQNQTSVSFVHMPRLEYWTNNEVQWTGQRVKQVGLNFGAPGDRMADNNTLWLDYPSVGGNSPDIPVEVKFAVSDTAAVMLHKSIGQSSTDRKVGYIRGNSFNMDSENHSYVAASGLSGAQEIEITLAVASEKSTSYTVMLYFTELESGNAESRIFDVNIQGNNVLKDFNIAKEAGGVNKLIIKKIDGVMVSDKLTINLSAKSADILPLISGVEVVASDIRLGEK